MNITHHTVHAIALLLLFHMVLVQLLVQCVFDLRPAKVGILVLDHQDPPVNDLRSSHVPAQVRRVRGRCLLRCRLPKRSRAPIDGW